MLNGIGVRLRWLQIEASIFEPRERPLKAEGIIAGCLIGPATRFQMVHQPEDIQE